MRLPPLRRFWYTSVEFGKEVLFQPASRGQTPIASDPKRLMKLGLTPKHSECPLFSPTAIVARVQKRGIKPVLAILHQNAGVTGGDEDARRVVQEWTLNMAEKRGGTVKAYRPVAK